MMLWNSGSPSIATRQYIHDNSEQHSSFVPWRLFSPSMLRLFWRFFDSIFTSTLLSFRAVDNYDMLLKKMTTVLYGVDTNLREWEYTTTHHGDNCWGFQADWSYIGTKNKVCFFRVVCLSLVV